jgi:hypothetical protein
VRFGGLAKENYMTPCILVDIYTHFEGTCCLHSSSLRIEAGHSFNTTVNIYRTTWPHIHQQKAIFPLGISLGRPRRGLKDNHNMMDCADKDWIHLTEDSI